MFSRTLLNSCSRGAAPITAVYSASAEHHGKAPFRSGASKDTILRGEFHQAIHLFSLFQSSLSLECQEQALGRRWLLLTCQPRGWKRRSTSEGHNSPQRHAPVESPGRPGSHLMRTAALHLGQTRGTRCWAALGLQRRAPQTPSVGPEAVMWPPLPCRSVEMASIVIGQGLAGHGAPSGPASVASKRSGRHILRAKPRQQRLGRRQRFLAGANPSGR